MDRRRYIWIGLAGLALLHWSIAFDALRRQSPTYDEIAHLPAGLAYLETGTFSVYRLSPPLPRMAAALAARPAGMKLDYDGTWKLHDPPSHWAFGYGAIAEARGDAELQRRYLWAFTLGRATIAAWSALTLPFLFAWGMRTFGAAAGWTAASLWAFCPNIVAHAGLVTTDLPAAAMAIVAAFAFDRFLRGGGWAAAGAAGLALGLAQLSKFTLLWLYPFFALWALADLRSSGRATAVRSMQLLALFGLSVGVINAGYLGRGFGTPLGSFPFASEPLTRERRPGDGPPDRSWDQTRQSALSRRVNRFRDGWLGRVPTPLPYDYVAGFDEQWFEARQSRPAYLNGEWGVDGRRGIRYFLTALALKTPPGIALLLATAVAAAFTTPAGPEQRRTLRAWIGLAAVPLAAAVFGTKSLIGYRYLLPALPFLFLLAGAAARRPMGKIRGAIVAAGVMGQFLSLAAIHPHELAYFNALAGTPPNSRERLIDSNLDWGQDLRRLSRWIADHPEWRGARIAYGGVVPPEFEGMDWMPAPRDIRGIPDRLLFPWENRADPTTHGPQPGRFVVGVNFERGMALPIPFPFRRPQPGHPGLETGWERGDPVALNMPAHCYSYFQRFTPRFEPAAGHSILLYELSRGEVNAARAAMGLAPVPERSIPVAGPSVPRDRVGADFSPPSR